MSDLLNVHKAPLRDFVWCFRCGTQVSNRTGVEMFVRAWVECPDCLEKRPAEPSWKDKPDAPGLWVEDWVEATTALHVFMIDDEPHYFDPVYRQNQGLCECEGYQYFGPIPAPLPTVEGEDPNV